jgi:hypothetical protein
LKVEAYYQHLFNVPVIANSSFSMINQQNDWFFNGKLQNNGTGKNYGMDITFEKYLSQGYYYMITASLFNSQYKGGDNVWRDTRYNRNFALNFLIGKEWQMGKNKQNILGLNARLLLVNVIEFYQSNKKKINYTLMGVLLLGVTTLSYLYYKKKFG